MFWTFLLKEWKPLSLLAILLFVGGIIQVKNMEINHLTDQLHTCQDDYAGLSAEVTTQNTAIKNLGQDNQVLQGKIAGAVQDNITLGDNLQTTLAKNRAAKVAPTCQAAIDYLESQAPALSSWP